MNSIFLIGPINNIFSNLHLENFRLLTFIISKFFKWILLNSKPSFSSQITPFFNFSISIIFLYSSDVNLVFSSVSLFIKSYPIISFSLLYIALSVRFLNSSVGQGNISSMSVSIILYLPSTNFNSYPKFFILSNLFKKEPNLNGLLTLE